MFISKGIISKRIHYPIRNL